MWIETEINGTPYTVECRSDVRALDLLRRLGFTSVKEGCGEGECGACSIFFDDRLVNACLLPAARLEGRKVRTLEGLREETADLRRSFAEHGAVQCGFCTPGFVMRGYDYLRHDSSRDPERIARAFDGNLCRCTGYRKIVEAVGAAKALPAPLRPAPPADEIPFALKEEARKGERPWLRPRSLEEAWEMRSRYPEYRLLSGASDLGIRLRREGNVAGIIDLDGVPGLDGIEECEGGIRIGSEVRIADLTTHPTVRERLPMLSEAAGLFASHQVRNLATVGGNIVNDSPAADLPPVLLAYGATVLLASAAGERRIGLEEFFVGFKSVDLRPGEILTGLELPVRQHRWYYRKTGNRERLNIAKLSLALVRDEEGFALSGATLNSRPRRFRHLERLLDAGVREEERLRAAIEADTDPSGSFRSTRAYRRRVLLNMLREALERVDG